MLETRKPFESKMPSLKLPICVLIVTFLSLKTLVGSKSSLTVNKLDRIKTAPVKIKTLKLCI